MKKIWPYISMFFAGAFAAMAMVFFKQKPQTVINAETYVKEQSQKIGKIKQKGEGNDQQVQLDQEMTKKEKRATRKAERKSRKSK
nr:hypothetical protein [uncultured Draconibacterium sp.]